RREEEDFVYVTRRDVEETCPNPVQDSKSIFFDPDPFHCQPRVSRKPLRRFTKAIVRRRSPTPIVTPVTPTPKLVLPPFPKLELDCLSNDPRYNLVDPLTLTASPAYSTALTSSARTSFIPPSPSWLSRNVQPHS